MEKSVNTSVTALVIDSPVGSLQLIANDQALLCIHFPDAHDTSLAGVSVYNTVLKHSASQLKEYFAGRRHHFELPLAAGGTPFQQSVWQALTHIPYGELRTYRDIACTIGREKAVRAVGAANGRNPIPIVVPCHRVIGSNGTLTGFAGGLAIKQQLLELEGAL